MTLEEWRDSLNIRMTGHEESFIALTWDLLFPALRVAANEKYKDEVIDTLMVEHWIGTGKDYTDKEDFIEQTIEYWIEEGVDK